MSVSNQTLRQVTTSPSIGDEMSTRDADQSHLDGAAAILQIRSVEAVAWARAGSKPRLTYLRSKTTDSRYNKVGGGQPAVLALVSTAVAALCMAHKGCDPAEVPVGSPGFQNKRPIPRPAEPDKRQTRRENPGSSPSKMH